MVLSLFASLFVLLVINVGTTRNLFAARFIWLYLLVALVATALMIWLTKSYQIIIRHLVVRDIVVFAGVAFGKALLVMGALLFRRYGFNFVVVVTLLDFSATFFLMVGVRIAMILVYGLYNTKLRERSVLNRVMVYGTSDKSVATLLRLRHSTHYAVTAFLVRGKITNDLKIDRIPIYPFETDEDLDYIALRKGIDAVLFAKDTDAQKEENGLIRWCSEHHVKTLIAPTLDEVVEGESLLRPRPIKVEDLLGRKEIKISMDEIHENFAGKVVMVTGAAGSIGSELVRQLAGFGIKQLILFDNAETPMHNLRLELEETHPGLDFIPVIGDIRQLPRLDYAFRTWHPQIVFHAAAYKHVPLMEENPCEAVLVNVNGTRNVADKCIEYDVEKMVMISTDKAVNPTNIMGCTKRLAEIYVQSLGLAIEKGEHAGKTRFVTTRFGNVLGSSGSVIPRFSEQIAKGGPVTVTDPRITRFFMTIPEACRLVMEAATLSQGNDIFIFDMGESVKIDDLARRMITLAGFKPDEDIKIEYTGLRPGEKLYEEVLATDENTLPAFHERIRIAKVREYSYDNALAVVDQLTDLSREVIIPDMVKQMKKTVPEFKSENSRFAAYDA